MSLKLLNTDTYKQWLNSRVYNCRVDNILTVKGAPVTTFNEEEITFNVLQNSVIIGVGICRLMIYDSPLSAGKNILLNIEPMFLTNIVPTPGTNSFIYINLGNNFNYNSNFHACSVIFSDNIIRTANNTTDCIFNLNEFQVKLPFNNVRGELYLNGFSFFYHSS